MVPFERACHKDKHDMHAKYECSIHNTSEDMSMVKVFATDRRMSFNVPPLGTKV